MSTVLANTINAVGGGRSTAKITLTNDSTFVSDGGAVSDTNLVQGLTKHWALASGDNISVADSFNSSSITDNGPGDGTFAFTNAFGNGNFATSSLSTEDGTIGYVGMYYSRNYSANANNVRLQGIDEGNNFDDGVLVATKSTGDLA